ncbi:2-amino-4-hydroxy-6-hydroxymethyldihydropteridine diphosphokinase [Mariprofundus erugo]|uniref:2-amino-4-hydroxy-6- hydroxymethyldihydropteridine diphosphokinase n=1 Tax=Mariprofundus erugo TaxID=2528639 RepID=UPI001EE86598|nr:2-amino-4-hydroxy-6-hydroxymethyldihydropteridine diphosphokinase [Mariprofundus erugo]
MPVGQGVVSALIGMGSNIDAEHNLLVAAAALRAAYGDVSFSSVYRSAAVGMEGPDFLNACCLLRTGRSQQSLRMHLKMLEDLQGRDRSVGGWHPRSIDLDVLIYDGEAVDEELYLYAHAYVPAAELVRMSLPEDRDGVVALVSLRL